MEKIGRVDDGGAIVKLTEGEWEALVKLQNIANDNFSWDMAGRVFPVSGLNITPMLAAIRLWIEARRNIEAVREVCDDAIRLLERSEGE